MPFSRAKHAVAIRIMNFKLTPRWGESSAYQRSRAVKMVSKQGTWKKRMQPRRKRNMVPASYTDQSEVSTRIWHVSINETLPLTQY